MYVNQESTDWVESSGEFPEQRSRKTAYRRKEEEKEEEEEEEDEDEEKKERRRNNAPSEEKKKVHLHLENVFHRDEESEEATPPIQLNERP